MAIAPSNYYLNPYPLNEFIVEAFINQLLLEFNYNSSTLEGKTVREILKRILKY